MLIISDTAALSALAEADLMRVLPTQFRKVVITQEVKLECMHPGAPVALRAWVAELPEWVAVLPGPEALLPETAALGAGEASSISLAWEHRPDSVVILDDLLARKVAAALGLNLIGLLAVVADAARAEIVDFGEAIQRLKSVDFRMSEAVIARARVRAELS